MGRSRHGGTSESVNRNFQTPTRLDRGTGTPDPAKASESDIVKEAENLSRAATPGPWFWASSNSWQRLMREGGRDGGVLCPTVHPVDKHPDVYGSTEDMTFIARARTLLPALAARVRELEADARWIPVSERIPKGSEKVLTYTEQTLQRQQVLYWTKGDERNVSHWRPLPKPPVKEEGPDHA